MFYSFDGIDGVGKSTQLDLFCDWLRAEGQEVVTCRDPGSTPLGERLREVLLHSGEETPIAPRSEMLLYMTARAQLVEEVIRPALAAGKTVVSDRFLLANIVYQAYAGGLEVETVRQVGAIATDKVMPDQVLLLDLDPEVADARVGGEKDRMEQRGLEYRKKLRAGFLEEARLFPKQVSVIDASQSIEAVHEQIREAVANR